MLAKQNTRSTFYYRYDIQLNTSHLLTASFNSLKWRKK